MVVRVKIADLWSLLDFHILFYVIIAVAITLLLVFAIQYKENQRRQRSLAMRAAPPRFRPAEGDVPTRIAGARRTVRVRQRHTRPETADAESSSSGSESQEEDGKPSGKIGAKKQRKLQLKEEKKTQRETEQRQREERRKLYEAEQERKQKVEREQEEQEKLIEEELRKERELKEKAEHEEYLKLKEEFVIEDQGHDELADLSSDGRLLQQFIEFIKESKVIMLEDLAARFSLKTQVCIDRVKTLQEDGRLTGVIDDRGKFIYITMDELQAVSDFIKRRGRVSISDLAESSNRLINLASASIPEKTLTGSSVEANS